MDSLGLWRVGDELALVLCCWRWRNLGGAGGKTADLSTSLHFGRDDNFVRELTSVSMLQQVKGRGFSPVAHLCPQRLKPPDLVVFDGGAKAPPLHPRALKRAAGLFLVEEIFEHVHFKDNSLGGMGEGVFALQLQVFVAVECGVLWVDDPYFRDAH
jgi:hypothetical protein